MESREQFLEWFAKEHEEVENSDELAAKVMKMIAWSSWQASRAAIEIESVERYSIDCFENPEQDDEGYLVYYDSVINAIRAAGLRVKEN